VSEDVLKRLEAIEDRQQIADLILDYCRGVDRGDDVLLRRTYWPDATDNHGTVDVTAAEFCDRVIPVLADVAIATMHLVANCRIELAGDHATGETYVIAHHFLKSGRKLDTFLGPERAQEMRDKYPPESWDAPFEYHVGARYLDRLEKRGGEWRFSHRQVVFDWTHVRPASEPMADPARLRGQRGRGDPGYGYLS
jgi:hypothetical protein